MNFLRDSLQVSNRLLPPALLSIFLFCLSFVTALSIAWLFGRNTYEVFSEFAIRWSVVVAMFFLAGLVVFADFISFGKCTRITAGVFAIFFLHATYATWFHFDPAMSNRGYFINCSGTLTYGLMVGAAAIGFFMWYYFRKLVVEPNDIGKNKANQFSIASIMIWVSIGASLLALLQRSRAFPVPTDVSFFTAPSSDSFAAVTTVFLLLPVISYWLMKTRHYFREAISIWIIVYAGSWIVYGLIGLGEPNYQLSDYYPTKMAAFAFATLVYLLWLGVTRRFLWRCGVQWRRKEKRRIAQSPLAIIGIALWAYLPVWLSLNVAVTTSNRYPSWVDNSPEFIQGFRDVFGDELMDQLQQQHNPESIRDWINCLARHEVPKEKDVLFQIASTTRLPRIDGLEGFGAFRKRMGFTQEEIEALPEKYFYDMAIFYHASSDNGQQSENLSEKLEDAHRQCQKFRDAIARSEGARILPYYGSWVDRPRQLTAMIRSSHRGWDPLNEIVDTAFNALSMETRYAIKIKNHELALKNLSSIVRLLNLISQNSMWQPLGHGKAVTLLLHTAANLDLTPKEIKQLRDLANRLSAPKTQTDKTRILALANAALSYKTEIEPPCAMGGLLGSFVDDCPQCIDWSEFCSEAQTCLFETEFLQNDSGVEDLRRLARSVEKKNQGERFHDQAMDIVTLPGFRSRRLARHCVDQWRRTDERIKNRMQMRMLRVALELLIYRNEHGDFPATLSEIDAPIIDPFTGAPLNYFSAEDDFELYSHGMNGMDDAGNWEFNDDHSFVWPNDRHGQFNW